MKDIKKYYLYIFVIGLVNAIYQLGLIKQLHVGDIFFKFLSVTINFMVAFTLLSLGVGTYLSRYFNEASRKKAIKPVLILLAFSILLILLFILLFLPSLALKPLSFLIVFITISIPMILIGISVGLIYPIFVKGKKIGILVFFHVLGFGLGQIIGILFIRIIGANTLFFFMFTLLFFLVSERRVEKLIIITIFFLLLGLSLEDRIESIRQREKIFWDSVQAPKHVFSGWSPYSKVDFYQHDTDCIAGLYNYKQQWMVCKDETKDYQLRILLYPKLAGDVLVIGTGGGVGINAFSDHTNITAVEIDPLVVKLMKNEFKEYNNNAYNKVSAYAKDGRAFLESNQKKYDYIIFEGADYTPTSQIKTFLKVDNYLYTEEGIRSALGSLKEKGSLLLFFTSDSLTVSRTVAAVPRNYFYEVRKFSTYSPIRFGGFLLTITKSKNAMEYLSSFFDNHPDYFKRKQDSLPSTVKITDNQPFFYLPEKMNISFYFYLSLFFILTVASISFLKKKTFYFYFFLLGIGMIMGELFYINIFRSLYSDYITTFVVVSIIFFSGFSAGAYYNKILKKFIFLTPFLMLVSLLATNFIPWSSGLGVKLLFSIIVLFPPALFMGVFFPLALANVNKEKFPLAYLLDSIGGAVGFFLFYTCAVLSGFRFSFLVTAIIYSILFLILRVSF